MRPPWCKPFAEFAVPPYLLVDCTRRCRHGNLTNTVTHELRIARVQRTLQWFEQDIPLLDMRVKELSPERQASARRFAAALIDQTRAELRRLLEHQPCDKNDSGESPCEPAD